MQNWKLRWNWCRKTFKEDAVVYNKVYDKYDKLITPLLEEVASSVEEKITDVKRNKLEDRDNGRPLKQPL
jgi:hypothetical protein